jgi:hypothetical protein
MTGPTLPTTDRASRASTLPAAIARGRWARSVRAPALAGPGQNGRMDLGLRDRVYLVTGGSRGLGFAAAPIPPPQAG